MLFFASSFENPKRKRLFSILYLLTNNANTFVNGILTVILMFRTVAKCSCCIIHRKNDHTIINNNNKL